MAVVSLVLLLGCGSDGAPTPAPAIDGLQTFTVDPADRHTTDPVRYERTPPAGGPHWPAEAEGVRGWLRCGVYDEPVPEEFAVHSQEHGAVWLTYLPGVDPEPLAALAAGQEYVLVSPYPGQRSQVMASTWGAQLGVDRADDPRLREFVQTYAGGGQGGEKGADCANGTLPAAARKAIEAARD